MDKYEFLIRFSMLNNKKPTKIRQYIRQSTKEIDACLILNQCQFNSEQINQFYQYDIQPTLDWINQDNHFVLNYDDQDYPEQLRQINSAPLLLFGIGNRTLLTTPQIAMVGSRQFSEYGAQWGRYFAEELAINGLTITSGLALGIDAICHRGALAVNGKTIAVLASGLYHISPKTNFHLARDIIANNGTLISEFLPHITTRAEYYPRRNRIISGLSLGTFVIEASENSGSLITACYALEQNRDIFALPGNIINENCHGTHWLIKQGANLVTKPSDILEHYAAQISWLKKQTYSTFDPILYQTHADILAVINHQAIPIDLIAAKTELAITDVTIKLIELELEGLVKAVTGGYIRNNAI